jgi:hypothetical protein
MEASREEKGFFFFPPVNKEKKNMSIIILDLDRLLNLG